MCDLKVGLPHLANKNTGLPDSLARTKYKITYGIGNTYTKIKFLVYLKFEFNLVFCILFGSPTLKRHSNKYLFSNL